MLYSDNDVTHNYNAKNNTKSNWSTAYFHCGPCPNKMTSKFIDNNLRDTFRRN